MIEIRDLTTEKNCSTTECLIDALKWKDSEISILNNKFQDLYVKNKKLPEFYRKYSIQSREIQKTGISEPKRNAAEGFVTRFNSDE